MPAHQPLDAAMDIAQPLFQPHDGLAIAGEAEMAGLDDARMDRPHGHLVQPLAFHGQKGIGRRVGRNRGRTEGA